MSEQAPDIGGTTCVILAGGRGTRLSSVVSDRPKVLAHVHGRPFLTFLLDHLAFSGVKDVVLCTGYMAGLVFEEIGPGYGPLRIIYSPEDNPLGTGGAVRNALRHVRSEVFILMNGDSYIDVDLPVYLRWFHEQERNLAVLLAPVDDVRRYGRVTVADDGSVVSFKEKGEDAGEGLINAGVYVMKKEIMAGAIPDVPCSLERDVLPELIGCAFYGYRCPGRFIDIGTPKSYRHAEDFFPRGGSINE